MLRRAIEKAWQQFDTHTHPILGEGTKKIENISERKLPPSSTSYQLATWLDVDGIYLG
jgi:hypothetical protein